MNKGYGTNNRVNMALACTAKEPDAGQYRSHQNRVNADCDAFLSSKQLDKLFLSFERTYNENISNGEIIKFNKYITEVFNRRKWNSAIFFDKTGLNDSYYSKIRNDKLSPSFHTVISIAVGLGITDISKVEKLLGLAGLSFDATEEKQAYRFLFSPDIVNSDIEIKNEFLNRYHIPPLGSN